LTRPYERGAAETNRGGGVTNHGKKTPPPNRTERKVTDQIHPKAKGREYVKEGSDVLR